MPGMRRSVTSTSTSGWRSSRASASGPFQASSTACPSSLRMRVAVARTSGTSSTTSTVRFLFIRGNSSSTMAHSQWRLLPSPCGKSGFRVSAATRSCDSSMAGRPSCRTMTTSVGSSGIACRAIEQVQSRSDRAARAVAPRLRLHHDKGALALNDYARLNHPFAMVGQGSGRGRGVGRQLRTFRQRRADTGPVGSPCSVRTISPPGGLGVFRVYPSPARRCRSGSPGHRGGGRIRACPARAVFSVEREIRWR